MNAKRLLEARATAPCPIDTWLLPLILETLEPQQRDIFAWLIRQNGESRSDNLAAHFDLTAQRAGSAMSDLRKLGLVTTHAILGEPTRASRHCVVSWVMEASQG